MIIKKAVFVSSFTDPKKCPNTDIPEFAFIGRSNVGKSSLLNYLVNIKSLAKTSSKPGKTRLLNYFLINEQLHFVDLPGYGYARFSADERKKWEKVITEYVVIRKQLHQIFILVDSRLKPQESDINAINFMGKYQIPFSLIFTKIDKLSKSQLSRNIKEFENKLKETWEVLPPYFTTSTLKNIGKTEILDYIEKSL